MIERHEITLPVEFDGELCTDCRRLFHASYGMICTAFTQLVEKTEDGKNFIRCPHCQYRFSKDKKDFQLDLF